MRHFWILLLITLSPVLGACATTQAPTRPEPILAPKGDDCGAVSDRFLQALSDAGLKPAREKLKDGMVYSGKFVTSAGGKGKKTVEEYYLVIKKPSPTTAEWNAVLQGDVSTCLVKKQSLDVILKMSPGLVR